MESYEEWRANLGLAPQPERYPKTRFTALLSNEAKHGLIQIAESYGLSYNGQVSISMLMECIGQFLLAVTSHNKEAVGFTDTDGLNEKICFSLGQEDYITKKPMSFETSTFSNGRRRNKVLVEAYCRGYTSNYVEELSESPAPFETTLNT